MRMYDVKIMVEKDFYRVTTQDIEVLEDAIARLLEAVEDVENKRQQCSQDFIQNANEQEQEFGTIPDDYENTIDAYESLEDGLDEVFNHIRHARDIVTDTLPRYTHRRKKREVANG